MRRTGLELGDVMHELHIEIEVEQTGREHEDEDEDEKYETIIAEGPIAVVSDVVAAAKGRTKVGEEKEDEEGPSNATTSADGAGPLNLAPRADGARDAVDAYCILEQLDFSENTVIRSLDYFKRNMEDRLGQIERHFEAIALLSFLIDQQNGKFIDQQVRQGEDKRLPQSQQRDPAFGIGLNP
ncbi:hypothetical protein Sjap_002442 [Stephania japonica]|uniref:Uncharacterized protein n=1 Tax=Stephania japonica TaxID=461633 RepID=A0AAP0KLV5_9MAGN